MWTEILGPQAQISSAAVALSLEEVFQETSLVELMNRLYNTVACAIAQRCVASGFPTLVPALSLDAPTGRPSFAKIGPRGKRIRALVAGDVPLQNDPPPE